VYLVTVTGSLVTSKKMETNDKDRKMCNNGNKGGKVYVDQWQAAGKCVISEKGGKVYDQWRGRESV